MERSKSPSPSILSDSYCESDGHSTEELGSRMEVHISGGESHDTYSSMQESPQFMARTGSPAGVPQSLELDNDLPDEEFTKPGNIADLITANVLLHQLDHLDEEFGQLPVGRENYAQTLSNLGSQLLARFEGESQDSDLDEGVSLHRQAIKLLPAPNPNRYILLNNLASVLKTRFKQGDKASDLDEAISLYREAFGLQLPTDPNQDELLNNLGHVLSMRFEQGGQEDDLDEAISFHRQALELQLPPHENRAISLEKLGFALLTRFQQKGHDSDADEAISLHKETLKLQTPSHRDWPRSLNNLAFALISRFEQGGQAGQQCDLDGAISLYRQSLQIQPNPYQCCSLFGLGAALFHQFKKEGHHTDLDEAISFHRQSLKLPFCSMESLSLNSLASMLLTRFEHGGQQKDLNEGISLRRQALELQLPPHENRAILLKNLGSALMIRFEKMGQHSDVDESISLHEQALMLQTPSHPNWPGSLNGLATALLHRFKQVGQQSDVDRAISLYWQSLQIQSNPNQFCSFYGLGNALTLRFKRIGHFSDLDEGISFCRQSLKLPVPLYPEPLNNLASMLLVRFDHGGQQEDLNEGISLHRQALELQSPTDLKRSMFLSNLATALSTQFKQQGQQSDLDEAILLHKQALDLQFLSCSDHYDSLQGLANALWNKFQKNGQPSDLDEAISLDRKVLVLQPPSHPDHSMSLSNLGIKLSTRYNQRDQKSDLYEAISLSRQALNLLSISHPERSLLLLNLAGGLAEAAQLRQEGHENNLTEAISLYRQALELQVPLNPLRSSSLSSLATALTIQFQQTGQQSSFNEAISLYRQALEIQLSTHSFRAGSLSALASALSVRFGEEGQQGDFDEAISLYREALELQPPPHPDRSHSFKDIANLWLTRYKQGGQLSNLDEAMSSYSSATRCLPQSPFFLFDVAKEWAHHADTYQHTSAIDAYETALQALPQLAALSSDIASRQEALMARSDGLARNASRCAIHLGNLDKAIEFLEAGRGIFWSQVLSLRSPFSQLCGITPELSDKLQDIAIALDLGSHRQVSATVFDNLTKLSIDQEASQLNRLNEKWVEGITEVRKLEGFEDFLCPKSLSQLMPAVSRYPVIILIANHDDSYCLIMTSTNIHHIPLPSLGLHVLQDLVYLVQKAVSKLPRSRLLIEKAQENIIRILEKKQTLGVGRIPKRVQSDELESSHGIFTWVLRLLWDELVKPVIDALNIRKFVEMPVLQWCPTGLFAFLPIHAAGCYDIGTEIDCAPDYFISSYTPTIGTLMANSATPTPSTLKMMIVISRELPYTHNELEKIEQHAPTDALVKFGIPGTPADVETVVSCLSEASIVHFACHGKQDPLKPLNSGLQLDDGMLTVARIMKQPMPNGSLAFLCACETAMGDEKVPDEAMSLAACLLFSGFSTVVGTMWEMMDQDGPTIANAFYEEIFQGADGKPALEADTTKSAQALHAAVQKLRSQNVSFCRWVPFIHMGK